MPAGANFYSTRGGSSGIAPQAQKKKLDFFFRRRQFFFLVHFLKEMAFFGKLLSRKSIFLIIFAIFCRFLAIFTFFLVHFHISVGASFLAVFPIFLGFVGIFWGTPPPIISPILGQFWPFLTTFGPFLDHFWAGKKNGFFFFFWCIFGKKWPFGGSCCRENRFFL